MFNEFGVPINDAEWGMYNIKPHEKILAESGVNNNIAFLGAMAAASAVSGFMSSRNKRKDAERAAQRQAQAEQRAFLNSVKQNAYKTRFDELMIEDQNKRTMKEFDHRIENYEWNRDANRDALIGSMSTSQIQLNELFEQASLNRNKQMKELMRVQGEQLASRGGNVNKSAERAALLNSLTEFGQEQLEMDKTLYSARGEMQRKVGGIIGQHAVSDYNAWSKIAIAPQLRVAGGPGPQLSGPPGAAKVSGGLFTDILAGVSSGLGTVAPMYGAQGLPGQGKLGIGGL
jgi:hypothetical protein